MGLIHLIRHAEPTLSGVFLGRADPGLRSRPQRSSVTVQCVFSSPLRRARDTASALFPSCEMVVLQELTEISLGEWDGLTWEEIEGRDPDLAAQKLADWNHVTPPGGESYAAIEGRARAAVADTAKRGCATLRADPSQQQPVLPVVHSLSQHLHWPRVAPAPILAGGRS